jgi:hypothetical protein
MNVLIATPTFGAGPHPETVKAIGALESAHTWEWRQYRNNPYPAPDGRNVLAQYQAIRDDFLGGAWDALLTIEHDMVPPPHAIDALVETGAPVAYGVYLFRHGAHVLNALDYAGTRNLGESLSLHRYGRQTGVKRVSGVGNGCTLIRREVVERFPFHDGGKGGQSPDMPLAQDCISNGILQVAHFGVLCGHYEKGVLLLPYEAHWTATEGLIMCQDITANIGGKSFPLKQGKRYDIPHVDAIHLIRGGYARAVASTDADVRPAGNNAAAQPPIAAQPERRGLVSDGDPRPRAARRGVGRGKPGDG